MSIFVSHVPFARLLDLVEGRVSDDDRAQMMRHLDTCQQCQTEVAHMTRLINFMRHDRSESAPAVVIARAVQLFQPQSKPTTPNLLQRITATLRFDSAQFTPALGIRAATEGQSPQARQLLYSADNYDLDIRITPAGEGWLVSGQVLSSIDVGYVELHGATSVEQTPFTPLSEFSLPPTAAGVYQLILYWSDIAVTVDEIKVGV